MIPLTLHAHNLCHQNIDQSEKDRTYDYIYLENVIYFNKIFYIKNSKYNNQDLEKYFELNTIKVIDKNLPQPQTVIKNTFICETLHGCWAHAVIDYAFAYLWCLDEKQQHTINS